MPDKKQIAFYIDVDNCGITYDNFIHAIANLQEMGEIIIAKVYGLSERKNKDIYEEIARRGFEVAPPLRTKKRGKFFDGRMVVDVMEDVLQNTNIDSVAIVAPPADMVYFYRRLISYNVNIIALDNNDEESSGFVDEFLDIGSVETINPPPKKKHAEKNRPKAEESEPAVTSEKREKIEEKQQINPAPEINDKIVSEEPIGAEKPEDAKTEKQPPRESETEAQTEIEFDTAVQKKTAETEIKEETDFEPESSEKADVGEKTYAAAKTVAPRSVADWQLAGEIDSMLKKIVVPDKNEPSVEGAKTLTVNPESLDPLPGEEKYAPARGDKVLNSVEKLEDDATPLDDENAELLDEIKKLLEEFKSE